MEPVIWCRGLAKSYRAWPWSRPTPALEALDLAVEPQTIVGLLGPNGSGKTTTMRLLLGLVRATAGEAQVFGLPPGSPAAKARTGFLPETSAIHPVLTGRETLDLYSRIHGIPRRERRTRVDALLERVGLEREAWRRRVGEYSKGMARRLGLAQSLVHDPALLIFDEPTSGLDPIGTRQVQDLILRLKEEGRTVLLSSHLLSQVERVCDRIAVLHRGRLVASGTTDDLLVRAGEIEMRFRGLSEEGRQEIRRIARERGAEVVSEGAPRERLEALFARLVGGGDERKGP